MGLVAAFTQRRRRRREDLCDHFKKVLQRMIDGKTRGIAIKALGAIDASFYSMENGQGNTAPTFTSTSRTNLQEACSGHDYGFLPCCF
jgi:hypothetical protein